jgi:hypothetical protein
MNERDLNLDKMREAVLKLEVTQYAKAEAQLAKEELREHLRQDASLLRNDIREERRAFYTKVFVFVAFLIGGDAWTMWGVYQHAQQVLQAEVEKNRRTVADVLSAETKKIRDQIQFVKNDLDQAQKVATEAEAKAASASKLAEESIQKITQERSSLTTQVAAVEQQLTGARQTSGQLDEVKKELIVTSTALKNQQRQLSDTSELVKMLFSKGQTDQFLPETASDRLLILPTTNRLLLQSAPKAPTGLAFLLLHDAAIPQTLQLQYFVSIQPRSSYTVLDGAPNVVVFRWGDSIESLKQHYIEANYIADKSASAIVKTLSVRDGLPYADGKPLPIDGYSKILLTATDPAPVKK